MEAEQTSSAGVEEPPVECEVEKESDSTVDTVPDSPDRKSLYESPLEEFHHNNPPAVVEFSSFEGTPKQFGQGLEGHKDYFRASTPHVSKVAGKRMAESTLNPPDPKKSRHCSSPTPASEQITAQDSQKSDTSWTSHHSVKSWNSHPGRAQKSDSSHDSHYADAKSTIPTLTISPKNLQQSALNKVLGANKELIVKAIPIRCTLMVHYNEKHEFLRVSLEQLRSDVSATSTSSASLADHSAISDSASVCSGGKFPLQPRHSGSSSSSTSTAGSLPLLNKKAIATKTSDGFLVPTKPEHKAGESRPSACMCACYCDLVFQGIKRDAESIFSCSNGSLDPVNISDMAGKVATHSCDELVVPTLEGSSEIHEIAKPVEKKIQDMVPEVVPQIKAETPKPEQPRAPTTRSSKRQRLSGKNPNQPNPSVELKNKTNGAAPESKRTYNKNRSVRKDSESSFSSSSSTVSIRPRRERKAAIAAKKVLSKISSLRKIKEPVPGTSGGFTRNTSQPFFLLRSSIPSEDESLDMSCLVMSKVCGRFLDDEVIPPSRSNMKSIGSRKKSSSKNPKILAGSEGIIAELGPLPNEPVFTRYHFVLTHTLRRPPFNITESSSNSTSDDNYPTDFEDYYCTDVPFDLLWLKKQITTGGGCIYESLSDVPTTEHSRTVLVSDFPSMTPNYLLGVAFGLRIIRHDSIVNCCRLDRHISLQVINAMCLPAGRSFETNSWILMSNLHKSKAIFEGLNFLFIATYNYETFMFWRNVIVLKGGSVKLLEGETFNSDELNGIDVVLADADSDHEIIAAAKKNKTPVLSLAWVIESIMRASTRVMNPNKYKAYDHARCDTILLSQSQQLT